MVSIEVANLGYEKEVLIHFDDGREHRAHFVESLPDNQELWVYKSPHDGDGSYRGTGLHYLKFSIKYVVNGETYWDNNGGWDYCLTERQYVAPAVWRSV